MPPDLTDRPLSEVKADLFKALGHPARVRALEILAEGDYAAVSRNPDVIQAYMGQGDV